MSEQYSRRQELKIGSIGKESALEKEEVVIRSEISAIDRVDFSKFPGTKLASFPWTVELQGKGEYREQDKTYVIKYPKGDRLLSYVTLIHELGHPRQHEHREDLSRGQQTHENLSREEEDAWSRGFERFQRANPKIVEDLENACKKRASVVEGVSSFEQLYQWVKAGVLNMVEMQRVLFEGAGNDRAVNFDRLADEMEKQGVRTFLENYARMKSDILIDDHEVVRSIEATLKIIEKEFPSSL